LPRSVCRAEDGPLKRTEVEFVACGEVPEDVKLRVFSEATGLRRARRGGDAVGRPARTIRLCR
jgi:hypothetical protein